MAKRKSAGEMPFLDHLEELRWKILWSLTAIIVGSMIGFYLVTNFDILGLLKQPIAPYLPDGQLYFTHPIDPFLITLKLAVLVGVVLAAPVVFWQIWTFLSPALYDSEKRRIVPALLAGFALFVAGAMMAYLWVLPAVLRISFSFLEEGLEQIITAGEYFRFATQVILAFGIVFQLPLFMTLVSAMGLLSPEFFSKNRRYALVISAVLAAILTPPDPGSMAMMVVPLVLLYEVGILFAKLVARKNSGKIAATMLFFVVLGSPSDLSAQDRGRQQLLDSLRRAREAIRVAETPAIDDTAGVVENATVLDTAAARALGLPTSPTRRFPPADSVIRALMERTGFRATRYAADSLRLHGETKQIDLSGNVLVEREGSTIEADLVNFRQADCRLDASGEPTLFDGASVVVGETMSYDMCERRGIVREALTNFSQGGVNWFLRGGLAVDSASTRIYSVSSNLSSCELPTPHYHFAAGRVKWVSNNIMVARPIVLYIRDVPILWLPFMFQDVRQGRRSGWLVPRFGINDLIRPSSGYRRSIANVGYYLALSDYFDVRSSFDWFSGSYVALNAALRYRWLDRFVNGGVNLTRIWESGQDGDPGGRSMRLMWNHQQSFDLRTRFSASVDYATSARVVERNTLDPFLATATLTSALNFNKQYDWGTLTIGGRRTQNITDKLVTETFPNVSLTPVPINIGANATWSPSFSFTNNRTFNRLVGVIDVPPVDGQALQDTVFASSRSTNVRFNTPLRVGRWNLQNSLTITDFITNQPSTVTVTDATDSTVAFQRFYGSDFSTGIDWNTGINLPMLFPSSWRLQPALGIRNSTSGPFLLRNRNTGGQFVSQNKRLSLSATVSPTLFGFFPGLGPLARIRHSISPAARWSYAPAATVPEEFARALNPRGTLTLRSDPVQTVSFGLSQTLEGKFAVLPGDSTDPRDARKLKLFSVQTSSIEYDFEQAKQEGRNGWRTQSLSNTFTSDLLPGFTLSMAHDLWDGPVGFDTTGFDPFLTRVSARFRLTSGTVSRILSYVTGRTHEDTLAVEPDQPFDRFASIDPLGRRRLGSLSQLPTAVSRGEGFSASLTYDDQRSRVPEDAPDDFVPSGTNRTLGFAVGFSPTQHWAVSWNTQYNFTRSEFGQHVLRLDRDLHHWRATFSFVRTPNGNVAFNFFVTLLDQPDIKFQYDQRTIVR